MGAGLPFAVSIELGHCLLVWAHLELRRGADIELREARREVSARVAQQHVGTTPAEHPVLAELRRLFRASGCDPTRYRPSSEALFRRLIKGVAIPQIHPLVDVSNCLSAEIFLPCVVRERSLTPPLCFRSGCPGEGYLSLRGPFNAAGKPLLVDGEGPCDTANRFRADQGHRQYRAGVAGCRRPGACRSDVRCAGGSDRAAETGAGRGDSRSRGSDRERP